MYNLRAVIGAAILGLLAGSLLRSAPLIAAARPAEDRIANASEQIAGQLRELTKAVERSDKQIEVKCK
jgi:hypothetical protein